MEIDLISFCFGVFAGLLFSIVSNMADKYAIEAIHRLSVENDKLLAEVEMLRKRLEAVKKTCGIAGRYISRPDGTVIRVDTNKHGD